MSFEPVTRWALRCDGVVPGGQCPTLCHVHDEHGDLVPALWETPELSPANRIWLTRGSEWVRLPDGRVLCPQHRAAVEEMAHASLDGLPFGAGGEE